jgi:hypothetical protein
MTYQISRNGEIIGAYTHFEITKGLMDGSFLNTDHYWKQGMTEWRSLSVFKIIEKVNIPQPSTPAPVTRSGFVPSESLQPTVQPVSINFNLDIDKLAYIGSGLIILSVFLPFISIGILNLSMSFSLIQLKNGVESFYPYILIVVGLIGLFLTFKNLHKYLLHLAVTSIVFMIASCAYCFHENPNMPTQAISLGIGFYTLVAGVIMVLFVGIRKKI